MADFRIVKLRAATKPRKVTKCEWGEPEDVAFYVAEMRKSEREKILNKLVKDRVCPCCQTLKIRSKSWVVDKEVTRAICRSCYMRQVPGKMVDKTQLDLKVFARQLIRYRLNPSKLALARVKANLSVPEFASHAGWSASYQYQLEDGRTKTVAAETAETIMDVLARFGFYTKDKV